MPKTGTALIALCVAASTVGCSPWYEKYGIQDEQELGNPETQQVVAKAIREGSCSDKKEAARWIQANEMRSASFVVDLVEATKSKCKLSTILELARALGRIGDPAKQAILGISKTNTYKGRLISLEAVAAFENLNEVGLEILRSNLKSMNELDDYSKGFVFEVIQKHGPASGPLVGDLIPMLAGDSVDEIHQIVDTLYAIGNPSQKTLDAVKITQERLDDPYVAKIYEKLRLLMVSSRKEEEVEPAAAAKQPVAASAGAATAGRQIVAVFNVHDASGKTDEQVLDQLTAYLTTAMAASGRFKVIPQNQIKARLMEQKSESYSECVDESCQIALGRSLAAQKSLATQLLKVGKDCAVTANLYDLKTETTEKGAMVKTKCGQDELLDAIGQVVEQLSAD